MAEELPLVLKQVVAVIDERTTIICLSAAGQIQPVEEPFDTINGLFDHPPFHISCRDVVAMWLPGFVNDVRRQANLELRRRPLKERRKADPRYRGKAGPPPVDENRPVDEHGQLIRRPGGPADQRPSVREQGLLDELADQDPRDRLQQAYDDGFEVVDTLSGGRVAEEVVKVRLSDGTLAVRKTATEEQADAEYLAGVVLRACGVRDNPVVRLSPTQVLMPFSDGDVAAKLIDQADGSGLMLRWEVFSDEGREELARQVRLRNGREVGLADWLMYNVDRHTLNWLVGEQIDPIDHGLAKWDQAYGSAPKSPFMYYALGLTVDQTYYAEDIARVAKPVFSREELLLIREELADVEGEFAERPTWFAAVMKRLEDLL